jgi:uncharacterized protein YbjT (DUF2867 family)
MPAPVILITAATGHIGGRITALLASSGGDYQLRAAVRPTRLTDARLPRGVRAVALDYDDQRSIDAALAGVDRLYLVAPIEVRFVERMTAMITAAARAGVARIVHQSQFAANVRPGMIGTEWHSRMETVTRESGVPYVILEPNAFMQNVLTRYAEDIRARDAIIAPAGDSRVSFIDPADIAACGAAVLTRDGYDGHTLALTGPESLSFADLANTLSDVLGRTIAYIDQTEEDFRAVAGAGGMDEVSIGLTLDGYRVERLGHYAEVTGTVHQLLGRPPRSFTAWAAEHAASFAPASAPQGR